MAAAVRAAWAAVTQVCVSDEYVPPSDAHIWTALSFEDVAHPLSDITKTTIAGIVETIVLLLSITSLLSLPRNPANLTRPVVGNA